ncbi:hypothetical protein [Motiliproteus sp.]|uniref:hypothetical protein n=1 Tax=Motiliproteus sp. TaxID=1898955 RepID=UPI003BAC5A88
MNRVVAFELAAIGLLLTMGLILLEQQLPVMGVVMTAVVLAVCSLGLRLLNARTSLQAARVRVQKPAQTTAQAKTSSGV